MKVAKGKGQMSLPNVAARPSVNGTGWGGRRKGAGRRPNNGRKAGVAHTRRPSQSPHRPLHVTVRLVDGLPRMRQRRGYQLVQRAVGMANRLEEARICHVSIQHNHVHLIIEAADRRTLTRTMRSFGICLAKNVNRRLAARGSTPRRGPVLVDRYHAVPLTTPAQTRAALAYVLGNWRRHREDLRLPGPARRTDRYSSGPYFDGWTTGPPPDIVAFADLPFPDDGFLPIRFPTSWLLRDGWKQAGLLSPWQRPGPTSA